MQAVAPISRGEAFMRHLKYNAVGSFARQTLDVAGGKNIGLALRDGLHNTTTNTLAAFAANQIGLKYFDKKINFFEHKCLHGGLGAAIGAVTSKDPAKGALSGAFAGVMAEVIGELLLDSPAEAMQAAMEKGEADTMENFLKRYDIEAQKAAEISKVITGAVSLASGLDMEVSTYVANNALKNNFVFVAGMIFAEEIAGFAMLGLGAASIAQLMQYAKGGPLADLTEKQWQSLVNWWQSKQNAMSAAPDIDTQDEGFTPHERGPQANITPIADPIPSSHVTPIADKLPISFITPVPKDVRQILEGFNIHDGPNMNILYKELERIVERVHGNSIDYKGPTHVYKITSDGVIQKYGESMQGLNKHGQSKRAEQQARKLYKTTGIDHKTEVVAEFDNKLDAKALETQLIKEAKNNDPSALPLNKTNH